tara:strand:- start:1043 stop:1786 length:744 start_codon:yes stop_codon:yes gene_type:complete
MRAALDDGEHAILKSILEQVAITAPRHLYGTEEACRAVMNFLIANGLQHAIDDDDEIWDELASKLFSPPPPKPENTSQVARDHPPSMPANKKEYFLELCRRAQRARLLVERHEVLKQQQKDNKIALTHLYNAQNVWENAHPGLADALRAAMPPNYKKLEKKIAAREWLARRIKRRLQALEDGPLYEAKTKLLFWASAPQAPPRLQYTYRNSEAHQLEASYPEFSDDDSETDELKTLHASFLDGGDED